MYCKLPSKHPVLLPFSFQVFRDILIELQSARNIWNWNIQFQRFFKCDVFSLITKCLLHTRSITISILGIFQNPYRFIFMPNRVVHVCITVTLFLLVNPLVYNKWIGQALNWSSLMGFSHVNPTIPSQNSGPPTSVSTPSTHTLSLLPQPQSTDCIIFVIAVRCNTHHFKYFAALR